MTDTRRDLREFCQAALGDWELLGRYATQRPGSDVLHIRDCHGAEFVAKRHLNRRKHRGEE